jgi:hypothetical protein
MLASFCGRYYRARRASESTPIGCILKAAADLNATGKTFDMDNNYPQVAS